MFQGDSKTAQMDREILPFEMGYLPEFFQRKAEVELHDSPENRQKGLKVMKDMMEKDRSFKGLTFDDDFLLQYLRCRKFNANRAFSQLKAFVNFRKNNKDSFKDFHFETIVKTMKNKVSTVLPYRCQDGCAILHVNIDKWIPAEFPTEEVKRATVLFVLQSLRDPMTQVNGFKVIFDVNSNPIRHIRHATPSNIYFLYHSTQECLPGRFKQIHFVNNSLTFKVAWTFIKPFFSAKMRSRVYIHDTPESLLEFFPAAVLPAMYGGELNDYDMSNWLRDVMSPEKLTTLGGGEAKCPVK